MPSEKNFYFVEIGGNWLGPISWDKLLEYVRNQVVTESTLVRLKSGKPVPAIKLFGEFWQKMSPPKQTTAPPAPPLPMAQPISSPPPSHHSPQVQVGYQTADTHEAMYVSNRGNQGFQFNGLVMAAIFSWFIALCCFCYIVLSVLLALPGWDAQTQAEKDGTSLGIFCLLVGLGLPGALFTILGFISFHFSQK